MVVRFKFIDKITGKHSIHPVGKKVLLIAKNTKKNEDERQSKDYDS
jgi:hypothetical protein